MMNVRVKTDTLTPHMKRMLRRIENKRPVLREMGTEVASMARKAFTDESLRPSTWAPLAPSTLKKKAKANRGSKPLVWSGTMARSPRVTQVGSNFVLVGSDRAAGSKSLAAIHQLGAPKAGIPARPFFPFHASGEATPEVKRRLKAILLRWLRKK